MITFLEFEQDETKPKSSGSANPFEIQVVGGTQPRSHGRGPRHRLRHLSFLVPRVQEQEAEGEHQHPHEDGAEAGDGAHPQAHRGG